MAEEKAQENKNTMLDSKKLSKPVGYNTSIVECPELNEWMGVTKGNVIVKVRQATLNEFHHAKSGDGAEQILELSQKLQQVVVGGQGNDKIAEALSDICGLNNKLLPEVLVQINLCESCVVEPKLTYDQVVKMSQFYPFVVSRIANEILRLTNIGAIKKNL